jgi:hypothetical protein
MDVTRDSRQIVTTKGKNYMQKAILLALMMIPLLSIGSSRIAKAMSIDLSQFRWKNRLLFLFAPDNHHPLFEALHDSLSAQKPEVADRDIIVFKVLESGQSRMDMDLLEPQSADFLRKRFNVSRGQFTVILVGKDGGVKLNRQEKTELQDIFVLIDAMPMRQEEMRQKKKAKTDSAE